MSRMLKKQPEIDTPPSSLALAGVCEIEAEAAPVAEGKTALPRFRMVAYATKTELEVLRASRPKAPMGFAFTAAPVTSSVLEAACYLAAGLANPTDMVDEQSLSAAHKHFRHGVGLQELMLEGAVANGYSGRSFRADPHTIMRQAFPTKEQIQAGLSTVDIGGILSSVANKFLLDGFFSVEHALGEDGGNLGDALFGGHVDGISRIVGEGHRRSP